ncbi:hypothetical protein QJQ45_026534 [Haematococcus lacustris]|nr:hypothetical protein QJQ45_026534 [Haematococcus lacustris]
MARGKAAVKAPVAAARNLVPPEPQESTVCPLCIEELDSTDMSFNSCPCGYRICLFCYDRVKLLCNSLCPGCRREYGSVLEARPPSEGGSDSVLASSTPPRPSGAQQQQAVPNHPPLPPARPAHSKPAAAKGAVPQRGPAAQTQESSGPGLPSGATWGTQATPRHEAERQACAVPAPVVADDVAWPSLAATATASAPAPAARQHRTIQELQDSSHRRSNSHTSSMDRVPSVSSIDQMAQDAVPALSEQVAAPLPVQGAQQPAQVNSVHVNTSVFGVLRDVTVPLPTAAVEPFPDTLTMLQSLNQAMREGSLTHQEAAAQLLSMIERQKAGHVAASKPPPGFGAPLAHAQVPEAASYSPASGTCHTNGVARPAHLPQTHTSTLLSPLDNPVVHAPPVGRYQPIGTRAPGGPIQPPQQERAQGVGYDPVHTGMPLHQQQQQQYQQHQQQYQHHQQQGSAPGTYSMWNGLPGLTSLLPGVCSSSYNPLLGVLGVSTRWQQQQQQQLHSGFHNSDVSLGGPGLGLAAGQGPREGGYDRVLAPPSSLYALTGMQQAPLGPGLASKAPPPGFGPTPQQVQQQQYRPIAAQGYNPLGHPLQQQQQGGLPAYRPQLGGQL